MTASQKKDESTPRADVDVTTDILTPGEVAAWRAAMDRKLPITEADLRALLAAAAEFPDPRTFMAEGKTEVPSINADSLGMKLWEILTNFQGVSHGRIEYVTTLAWTSDRRLLRDLRQQMIITTRRVRPEPCGTPVRGRKVLAP